MVINLPKSTVLLNKFNCKIPLINYCCLKPERRTKYYLKLCLICIYLPSQIIYCIQTYFFINFDLFIFYRKKKKKLNLYFLFIFFIYLWVYIYIFFCSKYIFLKIYSNSVLLIFINVFVYFHFQTCSLFCRYFCVLYLRFLLNNIYILNN